MLSLKRPCLLVWLCWNLLLTGCSLTKEYNNPSTTSPHAFHDPEFWHYFETQIRSKLFYCNFSQNLLLESLEKDRSLYENDAIFTNRRLGAMKWVQNDSLWVEVVLGACKERAKGVQGSYSKQLQNIHILEAFEDFVDHTDYFQKVALKMATKGQMIHVLGQNSSRIHDIDKLDPAMLVGYSERFEDGKETSLWNVTVERHTKINPHHQAHCIWQDCCKDFQDSSCEDLRGKALKERVCDCCMNFQDSSCEDLRSKALKEMVCDKVSRRLQKNLGGRMSDDMWNVEVEYFRGIPDGWLEKAVKLMQSMKEAN